jgi:hypothetical protein
LILFNYFNVIKNVGILKIKQICEYFSLFVWVLLEVFVGKNPFMSTGKDESIPCGLTWHIFWNGKGVFRLGCPCLLPNLAGATVFFISSLLLYNCHYSKCPACLSVGADICRSPP